MNLNLTKTVWNFDANWLRVEASDDADATSTYVYFERNERHSELAAAPEAQTCVTSQFRNGASRRGVANPGYGVRLAARWKRLRERLASVARSYARPMRRGPAT
jgi:hypothetical protein